MKISRQKVIPQITVKMQAMMNRNHMRMVSMQMITTKDTPTAIMQSHMPMDTMRDMTMDMVMRVFRS